MIGNYWKNGFAVAMKVSFLLVVLAGVRLVIPGEVAAEPFYKGKSIRVFSAYPPGGLADMRVRTIIPFLEKHIPGNPKFITGYMPPEVRLGNYMARGAKRDGLTAAYVPGGLVSHFVVKTPGVQYSLDDFIYLGSPESGASRAIVVRKELGIKTVDELRSYRGLRIGSTAVGSGLFEQLRLVEFVLGLQGVRWLAGYSTPETELAIERGEIDALTADLGAISRRNAHWYKEGRVTFIMTTGLKPSFEAYPELEVAFRGVPQLIEFADTPVKRQLVEFQDARSIWNWVLPKGAPEPAVKEFRQGLNQVFQDKKWVEQYMNMLRDFPRVTPGEEVAERLTRLFTMVKENPKMIEIYRQLSTSTDPVPTR